MFQVCEKRCDQCLFSSHRIVTVARMRKLLAQAQRNDQHFICHKHTLRHLDGNATEAGANVCCRGFYDRDPNATNFMRIAGRLHMVQFVDESGKPVTPSETQSE